MQTVQIVVKHIYMPNKKDLLDAGRVVTTLADDDLFEVLVSSQGVKGVDKVIRKDDLEAAIGAKTIATSQTQTLNNAGDSFTVDLTTLSPPVSAKKLIAQVLEEGTGAGVLFAQEREYNQNYPIVGNDSWVAVTKDIDTGLIYAAPYDREFFLKVDSSNKTSSEIGASLGLTTNKYGRAIYYPFSKKIFVTNNNSSVDFLEFDPSDETFTTFSAGSQSHAGIIDGNDGFLYTITFGTGVNTQLKRINPNTQAVANVGTPLVGSGTPLDFTDIIKVGNFIYTASFLNTTKIIAKIDITAGSPTWTTFALTGSARYVSPILVGNSIYWGNLFDNFILKWDTATDTPTYINVGATGFQGATILSDGFLYFFPRTATGFLQISPSDDSFKIIGNKTGIASAIATDDLIVTVPFTNTRVTEFDLIPPFIGNPSNPSPWFSVTNLFDSASSLSRVSKTQDYELTITEDGGGNAISLEVEMLTEGQKEVTLNILSGGFN